MMVYCDPDGLSVLDVREVLFLWSTSSFVLTGILQHRCREVMPSAAVH